MAHYAFRVSLTVDAFARDNKLAREHVAQYVANAVAFYCKSLNPGSQEHDYADRDALFDLHSVVVSDDHLRKQYKP